MLKHSLSRRTRAAISASATLAALVVPAATTFAEPHPDPALLEAIAANDPTGGADSDELLEACPIDGEATFEDSWGWARSGGRRHEGVDMIADRGTPVVAVRDGNAVFKNNRLGGRAVWLTTSDGDRFYYAHLDAFAGDSREVQVGDVIGFVGSSGNAHGPHLHFETLPEGSVENPFPHTVAACVPTADELEAIAAHQANVLNDPAIWGRFLPAP